jgi:transposase
LRRERESVVVVSPAVVSRKRESVRTIGLDVHRRFAQIAILDGKEEHRLRISTEPDALREFAGSLGPDDQVVLEATANTWPIADLLAARAGRVVVSNPLRTRAIADAKIKTDTVDARTLAQLLAADFIPEVWVPDPATRALRGQIARHRALVQQRTRLRNQIHAALIRSLLACPHSDLFGRAGRRWLAGAALAAVERAGVDSALRLHDGFQEEIALLDRELSATALADPQAQLLCTINGIGPITALALLALIGPISRFARPNKLVGYLGLDPTVRQSGDRAARLGHISRAGQAHARGLLVEAAHDAVRSPGPLAAFHARIAERRGPAIAAVAVARKLAVIMWHLLTECREYRFASPTRLADKRRRMELRAGASRRQRRARTIPSRAERLQREQAQLWAAERTYRDQVRERARAKKQDAAAATGERPDRPRGA